MVASWDSEWQMTSGKVEGLWYMDSYKKWKQIRHSEPKWPHAFHGCQVPGTNTQLTTAASQMHLCLLLWLSWNPIKIHERQLKPLIVVGTPGKSWNMWYSQRTLPEYGSFFPLNCNPWHLMAILRLKRYRKMSLMSPWECTKCASPRPRHGGTKKSAKTFRFIRWILLGPSHWLCWQNILKLLKLSKRKCTRLLPPQCPQRSVTRATAFRADDAALGLTSCCQLSLVTWELSFIHQCLASKEFKHSVISSLL